MNIWMKSRKPSKIIYQKLKKCRSKKIMKLPFIRKNMKMNYKNGKINLM